MKRSVTHSKGYITINPSLSDKNFNVKMHMIKDLTPPAATVTILAASSHHAKMPTEAVTDFNVKGYTSSKY